MIFGIQCGKVFIMFCIVISQICMTWCDSISDALIAQASRSDLQSGAANLNTITMIAFALGGIIACTSAGFIEMNGGDDIDPNFYFGSYAGLIFILLLASIFLNRQFEPDVILLKRYAEYLKKKEAERRLAIMMQASVQLDNITDDVHLNSDTNPILTDNLCTSCGRTFSAICQLLSYSEFFLPLLFFFI